MAHYDDKNARGFSTSSLKNGSAVRTRANSAAPTLAPVRTITIRFPLNALRRAHRPASPAEAPGSTRVCPHIKSVCVAANKSRSLTSHASSRLLISVSSASFAGILVTRQSAIVCTGRERGRRALKLSTIAGDPDDWTATTRALGWTDLTETAVPAA